MKIMIASDVHGSSYYAEKIKQTFDKEGAGLLVLLGDIYNPGPRNPIENVREYAPLKVADTLNSLKDRLLVIKGNCDSQVDTLISEFHFAEEGQLFVAGRRITLTHGHIFNEDSLPPAADIFLYGHTHIPVAHRKDGVICFNPGSAGIPKGGFPASYGEYVDGVLNVRSLEDDEVMMSIGIRS